MPLPSPLDALVEASEEDSDGTQEPVQQELEWVRQAPVPPEPGLEPEPLKRALAAEELELEEAE